MALLLTDTTLRMAPLEQHTKFDNAREPNRGQGLAQMLPCKTNPWHTA